MLLKLSHSLLLTVSQFLDCFCDQNSMYSVSKAIYEASLPYEGKGREQFFLKALKLNRSDLLLEYMRDVDPRECPINVTDLFLLCIKVDDLEFLMFLKNRFPMFGKGKLCICVEDIASSWSISIPDVTTVPLLHRHLLEASTDEKSKHILIVLAILAKSFKCALHVLEPTVHDCMLLLELCLSVRITDYSDEYFKFEKNLINLAWNNARFSEKKLLKIVRMLFTKASPILIRKIILWFPDVLGYSRKCLSVFFTEREDVEILKMVLDACGIAAACDDLDRCIVYSSTNGFTDTVSFLLSSGCFYFPAIDYNDAFVGACMNGNLKIVKMLLERVDGLDVAFDRNLPFRIAVEGGHIDVVTLLLKDNRIDPYDNFNEALEIAEENNFSEIVCLLKTFSI